MSIHWFSWAIINRLIIYIVNLTLSPPKLFRLLLIQLVSINGITYGSNIDVADLPDILRLPRYIHYKIFKKIGSQDLYNIARVNRTYYTYMQDNKLWYYYCCNAQFIYSGLNQDPQKNYKEFYQRYASPLVRYCAYPDQTTDYKIVAIAEDALTMVGNARAIHTSFNHAFIIKWHPTDHNLTTLKFVRDLVPSSVRQNFNFKAIGASRDCAIIGGTLSNLKRKQAVVVIQNCEFSYNLVYLEINDDSLKNRVSQANGISYDGMVVVGYRQKSQHAEREAMKWIICKEPLCVDAISLSALNGNQSAWATGVSGNGHAVIGQINHHQSFTIPYRDGIIIDQSDDMNQSSDLYVIHTVGYDRSYRVSLPSKDIEDFDMIRINQVSLNGHTANITMINMKKNCVGSYVWTIEQGLQPIDAYLNVNNIKPKFKVLNLDFISSNGCGLSGSAYDENTQRKFIYQAIVPTPRNRF